MRLTIAFLLLTTTFFSCKSGDKIPDVSNIKVDVTVERFDKDLFQLDSSNFPTGYDNFRTKYPDFAGFFSTQILGFDPKWPIDSTKRYTRDFTKAYRPIYDSSELIFADFSIYEKDIKQSLQFLKYYFPSYKAPTKVITYIGPLDGYGDIFFSDEAFVVGLQLHLGRNFSEYKTPFVRETYPDYISDRFEPSYITVNCMKNLLNDMYPEKEDDRPMVDQMVDKGKRLYVLSKLLPYTEEYKLIGYTDQQLKACYDHETAVWNLFVQNGTLQSVDKEIIKTYLGESPKTEELGQDAPGNIGSFAGWQIIKKYMRNNTTKTLPELMSTDAETIFQETKYKP